jgi:hypothetical protein
VSLDGSLGPGFGYVFILLIVAVEIYFRVRFSGRGPDELFKDPLNPPFFVPGPNSDVWTDAGRKWRRDQRRVRLNSLMLLVVVFLVLDLLT